MAIYARGTSPFFGKYIPGGGCCRAQRPEFRFWKLYGNIYQEI